MVGADESNHHHSGGTLYRQRVGIALGAILVGVGLLVIYGASDGALFPQPSPPAEIEQKQGVVTPNPSMSSEAVVISSDVFEKQPSGAAANLPSQSQSKSQSKSQSQLQPQQESPNAAASNTEQELLAIKNFPWSSISEGYAGDSEEHIDTLMQHFPQNQSMSDGILTSAAHMQEIQSNDNDQSASDQINNIPPQEETSDEPLPKIQDEETHQDDPDNSDDSSDGSIVEVLPESGVNNSSSVTIEDDQQSDAGIELPYINITDSSASNSTENSSTLESANQSSSTGLKIDVFLG